MEQKNLRVLGLDVSKSSVSACLLTSKPIQPRQFYYECPFFHFDVSSDDIKAMLALEPNIAVLEPTGINYSRIWTEHLINAGVSVRLVGHKELKNYRAHHLGLPDKDDDADALALACYLFEYLEEPRRFVHLRESLIAELRLLVLRLAHLNRVQSPIINRIRQDLAWQFPEVALIKSHRWKDAETPALWAWLAGERDCKRYDYLYQKTAGLGIKDTVRRHAERLCSLQREEAIIEKQLHQLLAEPRFQAYIKVFARFGFGDRAQAILLSQIYPLSNYLGVDGKPIVKIRKGRNSGKPTKRHLSLRRFQKALGVAPTLVASGDTRHTKVVGGSDLCRKTLWQWAFTRIEVRKLRLKNDLGEKLGALMDAEKACKPVQIARSRVIGIATRMLFKELVKELTVVT